MDRVDTAGAAARTNVAFLFAGQGSQKPGMGQALYEASPAARAVFDAVEEVRPGTREQCFSGTKEELSLTINTQPCVFAVDLACACALRERGVVPAAAAGHSLGEVSALAFAGAFDTVAATRLVSERARLMTACCEEHPGAMRAVLKLDATTVEELAAKAGEAWPVNYNSPLQTVVAGSPEACEKLDALVREARERVAGPNLHEGVDACGLHAEKLVHPADGVGDLRREGPGNLCGRVTVGRTGEVCPGG